LLSAHSEGGRSLARDIAQRTGEIVRALAMNEETGARDGAMIAARI
jgi:L-ornithine N5-oxygenase